MYLHGGAYYVMSAATHRFITISVSKYTDCRVFAVNYRLAPECRWPGQIHDAISGYFRLIHDLKIPPENIIFAGDSAGGGLTLATMMYLRDNGLPLPSGAIVMSPWVDLTMSCDSWETNAVGPVTCRESRPIADVDQSLGLLGSVLTAIRLSTDAIRR
jgi:acetyl esterase/lipase